LRDQPTRKRHAEREEHVLTREQLEVLRRRLAEADAGSTTMRSGRSRRHGSRRSARAGTRDLAGDVVVDRFGLHRARRAAHVHQADAAARMRRDELDRARRSQRGDVVDDVGAEVERGAHDLDLGRVDRDRAAEADRRLRAPGERAPALLDAHRQRAGPARLAADVEDVGAFGEHLLAAGDRLRRRQARAAFGERVGRDVDDAHHARPREVDREAARPPDRAAHEKRGRSPVSKRLASIALRRLPARCPASPAARCRSA
jgi:hypothetical protein